MMDSRYIGQINLGTEEMETINELVDIVCQIAGKRFDKIHDKSQPQGVRGRNSDNTLLRSVLGWQPKIPLRVGLEATYRWIWSELDRQGRARRSEEHTSELQSRSDLVCRLLLEKKNQTLFRSMRMATRVPFVSFLLVYPLACDLSVYAGRATDLFYRLVVLRYWAGESVQASP